MKHTLKQIFHSPKFVVGFVIFMSILLASFIWPLVTSVEPLQNVSNKLFTPPGTYVSVVDVIEANDSNGGGAIKLDIDTLATRIGDRIPEENAQTMISWLYEYGGVAEGSLSSDDMMTLITTWQEKYDSDLTPRTVLKAERNRLDAIDEEVQTVLSEEGFIIAQENEEGVLEEVNGVVNPTGEDFVNVNDVANTFTFILGTDNFGRDMLTQLLAAVQTSLGMGLMAGLIATVIGLTLGLVAGYTGGIVDNFITFITNLFTVIPSFIILILVANAVGQNARGTEVVGLLIGITAWPWTCRSVRSQVISLRNRDHVNISKLSGHSMARIIVFDILPYVASYVVMALILQISSAILSETQLSMLGLGPATNQTTTLGTMMSWASQFSAHIIDAWWGFLPIVIVIALISFSLNLMNTGLDQVFNPQLRD